jgi:hypothetical protein
VRKKRKKGGEGEGEGEGCRAQGREIQVRRRDEVEHAERNGSDGRCTQYHPHTTKKNERKSKRKIG